MQNNFPMATVIDAAQRKAQLDNETTLKQSELFNQSIGAIGTIGKSLMDQKKQVAQALALGKQFNIPDNVAKTMEPAQILEVGKIKQSQGSMRQFLLAQNPKLLSDPGFMAAFAEGGNPTPQTSTGTTPSPIATAKPEAVLASNSPTIPMPAQGQPDSSIAPPPQPAPAPVPIAAPPINPLDQPLTKGTMSMLKLGMANRPKSVLQYTPGEGLKKVGEKENGDQVITSQPKEPQDVSDPKYQGKLEKQYADMKMKVFSNKSGGVGLENLKVDQAIHLRKAINQQYDPKTGQYNIPPSMHSEFVLGLARLMSPNGQVAHETMNDLRQRTAREGAANVLISLGFNPDDVGGTTQSVAKFFVKQIDRQGLTSEENRQGSMDYIHGQASTDLDPARIAAHDKKGLNSFSDLLSKSPDYKAQSHTGYEFTNPEKEKRYQEFKARQK